MIVSSAAWWHKLHNLCSLDYYEIKIYNVLLQADENRQNTLNWNVVVCKLCFTAILSVFTKHNWIIYEAGLKYD